jgi:hypothetical protein
MLTMVTSRKYMSDEMLAWATLSHENICPLLGVFESKSVLFFVYAHGENGTLHEWRRTSKRSAGDVLGRVSLITVSWPLLTYFLSCWR